MPAKLVVDTFAEVYEFLQPWIDHEFWEFSTHEPIPDSVYVIGRRQFEDNVQKVISLCNDARFKVVFCNVAEGGETQLAYLHRFDVVDLVASKKLLLLTGADPGCCHAFNHDHFLERIMTYLDNQQEVKYISRIFENTNKPYKFLFLNGRARPHRKFLYETFRLNGLLDQCLWTMLDGHSVKTRELFLFHNEQNLIDTPSSVRYLPKQYEVDRYVHRPPTGMHEYFCKHELFDNEWGEIYINHKPYVDTYFSLVTETTTTGAPFRTEKIAKPLAMGHPWIVATTPGFYRAMKSLGFQTFDHLIDESFDNLSNTQDRMERIAAVVADLCRSDLKSFLAAAESVCKYNQQHLLTYVESIRKQFPQRFFDYINE